MQYVLFALMIFALSGCGTTQTAGTGTNQPPGKITAAIVLPKSAAKSVGAQANVVSTKLVVTGASIPTASGPISSTGGTIQVYPGSGLIVAAYSYDSAGNLIYEGFATAVTVTSGISTNVTITLNPPVIKAETAPCLVCHENTRDVDGQNLVADYKQSGHYTNTGFMDTANTFGTGNVGAGCVGCHGPSHNIQNPSDDGTGANLSATNGTNVRCFDCHNVANSNTALVNNHGTFYLANGNSCSACHQIHNTAAANMERKTWAQSRHGATDFANMAGGATFGNCANRCHNPQGFIAAVNNPTALVQGNITAQSQQMITCNACHSDAPRGILRTLAGTKGGVFATYTTSSKGYQFAPNQAAFNPNKKAYYPDVAGSNLCVVFHSGTTEGTTASPGLSDPYFVNSATAIALKKSGTITQHNMPAAAVMYVKFGFTNLSTGTNGAPTQAYLDSLTSDLDSATGKITSTHRKFGTSAIAADSHFSATKPAPKNLLTNGPCAVCHVSGSHTFKIDQAAVDAVCSNCHTSENGHDISNINAFTQYFVDAQQEVYRNAILLGATIVNSKVAAYNATLTITPNALGYSTANPLKFVVGIDPFTSTQPGKIVLFKYWLDGTNGTTNAPYNSEGAINVSSSSSTSSTYAAPGTANANYLSPAATTAPYYQADLVNAAIALGYSKVVGDGGYTKFIGAISNLAFFAKDQGGFAHARTYTRRLIYDSLDFLDDGILNMSVSTTAKTQSSATGSAVAGLYTKGTAAYNTLNGAITVPASGTSESMLYLVGWNRTTGAWSSPERP
jgi:hypothetical protein